MMLNTGIDLKLTKQEDGNYDFTLDSKGSLEMVANFDSAIIMSVFCEKRASNHEIIDNSLRRGWWGNELSDIPGFEIGSKLWLLEQSRNTLKELNLSITYMKTAFEWFVTQDYAQSVIVTGELTSSGIRVNIDIRVSQDNVDTPSFDLWLGTGINITG